MTSSRPIKINFQGASHEIVLPTPVTLSALQAAVASAFKVELPARDEAGDADSNLSFTYMDSDGDDIVFDRDSELGMALRLCPSPLEISAAGKQQENKKEDEAQPEETKRIYRRAARKLREYHGVPSMTPRKLVQTLDFLELRPRRLLRHGLAPADNINDWDAGVVTIGDGEKLTPAPAAPTEENSSIEDEEEEEEEEGASTELKNFIHALLLSAGIKLRPREVIPLFLAIGVHPRRLVMLGRVDGKELRAILENARRLHFLYGGGFPWIEKGDAPPSMARGHPGMAHGRPGMAHPRAGGGGPGGPMGYVGNPPGIATSSHGGGGACGQGGNPSGPPGYCAGCGSPLEGGFACQPSPPPPPPHANFNCGGGGGGPGGFCGRPHHHGQPGQPGL